ncbi:PREDICTED: uncharacterized protein LOC109475939 [Branchiostoma belcheri]|uniref:Uncharacterized protein LOC109475939 n=1 Tax=Branchiostoma belcheri TaxID=7741 RepID=A0A6P4Z6N3_BRABE|nr:PREDICTED: uncharacterized protein LOC109475939 [Branchiostoma belcheri]
MCLENQVLNASENNTVAYNATVINNFNLENTTTKEMVTNRRVVTDDRSEKERISMVGLISALVTVGSFCLGLTLAYVYRKRQLAGRNNHRNSHFKPTMTVAMKNIHSRGRASSLPLVVLRDTRIFDNLHTCRHLQRQYSVPNFANKNSRGSHGKSFDAPHYWEIPDALVDSNDQPAPGQLDAPHYWEIPDSLVDFDAIGTPRAIPGTLVNSTRQPTTDERGEAHYWEIPDALVHSAPNSEELDKPREIPEPLVNSTCQPTTDALDGAHYWNTIRAHRRPSSLPIDILTNHNNEPRPCSLPHQYWNNPDEDIDGDSTTFYASAAEPKFTVVTRSEDCDRLYKGMASSTRTQTGGGHSIQATYRTDDVQTAFVAVTEDYSMDN